MPCVPLHRGTLDIFMFFLAGELSEDITLSKISQSEGQIMTPFI